MDATPPELPELRELPDLPDLPDRVDALVIGAGQAGLSVAYHLQRLGMRPLEDFAVVDRGPTSGGAWQHRWPALRLDDTHRVNDLPGMHELGLSFADQDAQRPAREVVPEVYREFERAYDLRVVRPVRVEAVRYAPEGFRASLVLEESASGGDTPRSPGGSRPIAAVREIAAAVVVNASGTWGAPHLPDVPGRETFRGRQVHTNGYAAADDFAGGRVAVVGGGTSAIGIIGELDEAGVDWTWFTRRPVVFTDTPEGLGVEGGIAAVRRQDEAARAGLVLPSIVSSTGVPVTPYMRSLYDAGRLVAHPMFTEVLPDGVRLAADDAVGDAVGGSVLPLDAIVWATGFRAELDHLDPLELREPGGGIRVVDGRVVREPRVWLAGYGPQASTISANRAGRATARAVARELGWAR